MADLLSGSLFLASLPQPASAHVASISDVGMSSYCAGLNSYHTVGASIVSNSYHTEGASIDAIPQGPRP